MSGPIPADGKAVKLVTIQPGADAATTLAALELDSRPPLPVILVCGGAATLAASGLERAERVVGAGTIRAARAVGAGIVDGGTDVGVMSVVGRAAARFGNGLPFLLGVAPGDEVTTRPSDEDRGLVRVEPNHSHVALVEGATWGGETLDLIALVSALSGERRVAVVLAGGGDITLTEAVLAARRGWPIYAIEGTGGIADALAARVAGSPPSGDGGAEDLDEIVERGDVRTIASAEGEVELARQLMWELQDESVLKRAWETFAAYDMSAGQLRKAFERMQWAILGIAVLATLLALIKGAVGIGPHSSWRWVDTSLHWATVTLPIVVGALIAAVSRFALGKRWVLLRAAAEAMKSEVYRYRTRTGSYAEETVAANGLTPQQQLAARLDAIDERLVQTEASSGAIPVYRGPLPPEMWAAATGDDGLTVLDPSGYIAIRVSDQISYYRGKVGKLAARRRLFYVAVIAAGGAGTLLAATGHEVWIGLTTAISAAAVAYLGHLQVDNTIIAYNQSASRLERLQRQWDARPVSRQTTADFGRLVDGAETVLTTELAGWVQQMSDALRELEAEEAARRAHDKPKTKT
jgi:SLOG in TRPM, prokaryote/SMODS and SLOG-associating 2TM effector domain 1/Protein of unknown function (DUF4231)